VDYCSVRGECRVHGTRDDGVVIDEGRQPDVEDAMYSKLLTSIC
jgi:hypothetical protein